MTLGPIVGLLRCAPPRPPHPKSGRGRCPWGINPHGRSYGEVLLICRGYLCYSGFVCLAAPAAPSSQPTTAHLVALLRHRLAQIGQCLT